MFRSSESGMAHLREEAIGSRRILLDQCEFGAKLHGERIRKATEIHTNRDRVGANREKHPAQHLTCQKHHTHLQLRGCKGGHSLTAQAAIYPPQLCEWLLAAYVKPDQTPTGGDMGSGRAQKM